MDAEVIMQDALDDQTAVKEEHKTKTLEADQAKAEAPEEENDEEEGHDTEISGAKQDAP